MANKISYSGPLSAAADDFTLYAWLADRTVVCLAAEGFAAGETLRSQAYNRAIRKPGAEESVKNERT